jgi:hypothetical protein
MTRAELHHGQTYAPIAGVDWPSRDLSQIPMRRYQDTIPIPRTELAQPAPASSLYGIVQRGLERDRGRRGQEPLVIHWNAAAPVNVWPVIWGFKEQHPTRARLIQLQG